MCAIEQHFVYFVNNELQQVRLTHWFVFTY
jgi:hypothetical protein